MNIYDNYAPKKEDLDGKSEVAKHPVSKPHKSYVDNRTFHEMKSEKNPNYVTPDLRKKWMNNTPLVQSPFSKLKF